MSVLSGLFLLGGAAILGPILFHLIRRTPKARYEFSSLLFLEPTPPKLTKRSRFDQWLLLLLRSLVILLLAFAFMRPFFRTEAELLGANAPNRYVAILIDQSASMRRSEMWDKTLTEVRSILDNLEATDEVSLFAYADELTPLVSQEEAPTVDGPARHELVRQRLKELKPTWGASNLGSALLSVSERLTTAKDQQQSNASMQIVLITDLQQGTNLESLQAAEWNQDVQVDLHRVESENPTNAKAILLDTKSPGDELNAAPKVRVRTSADATHDSFFVAWGNAEGEKSQPVPFYVPPGESLVLGVSRDIAMAAPDRILLTGDEPSMDFDNTYYVVPPIQKIVRIGYFGNEDVDDPADMLFYLSRAFGETPDRRVEIASADSIDDLKLDGVSPPQIVFISQPATSDQRVKLDRYLDDGGNVLVILKTDEMAKDMGDWLGGVAMAQSAESEPSTRASYTMLEQIDFQSPLFLPFANARYNDFTNIRFWKFRPVNAPADAQVLARFDTGHPAIWQVSRGQGELYVMTSGWHKEDSQLALSTKFIPLLSRWLELSDVAKLDTKNFVLDQDIPLPQADKERTILFPDGQIDSIAATATTFSDASEPGIYTLIIGEEHLPFAVNLAESESDTQPLDASYLEQLGVVLGEAPTTSETLDQQRQLRDLELEQRQKVWKWLIVAVLILLGAETILGRLRSRTSTPNLGDSA